MGLPDPAAGAVAPLQPGLRRRRVLAMQDDWRVAKVKAREGKTNTKKGNCYPGSDKGSWVCGTAGENTPMTVPSASCECVLSLLGLAVSCPGVDISQARLYLSHFSILRGTLAQMSAATRNRQKLLCSWNVLCPRVILRTKGTACNSAPGFSDFNLVSTLLSFLTLFTRLLHTTRSLTGAPKGLPALQRAAVFPKLFKKWVCISPGWNVNKGLLIKQCVRSYSVLYKSWDQV